jgi:hypothetical protein
MISTIDPDKTENFMQYMLAIFENESNYADGVNGATYKKIVAAHMALVGQMEAAGVLRGGAGLLMSPTATTVKTRAGKVSLHDGPFIETKEQLGGFYLVEVESLDDAIAWAKRIPLAHDGAVEVRPTLSDEA